MNETRVATTVSKSEERYLFPCPACSGVIDASTAKWCSCVVRRPAPICEHCGGCLDKAESNVLLAFWNGAPDWVLARNWAERRVRASQPVAPGHTIDVMIVDDDEEIRTVAAFMVEQMGCTTIIASDAAEALELMKSMRPALVITDALMPKLDGRQLCRFIKAEYPDVAVVIMTSLYKAPRYKYEAFKTFRADDYLLKPIEFKRFSDVVRRFVPARVAVGA